jgi:hypothetical protein
LGVIDEGNTLSTDNFKLGLKEDSDGLPPIKPKKRKAPKPSVDPMQAYTESLSDPTHPLHSVEELEEFVAGVKRSAPDEFGDLLDMHRFKDRRYKFYKGDLDLIDNPVERLGGGDDGFHVHREGALTDGDEKQRRR